MLGDTEGVNLLSRFSHSEPRRFPFARKDTRVLVQILSIHTYVLCTQTNTREHLRGVQDFLVTKVMCTRESRRERKRRDEGAILLRNGNT